MKTIGVLANCRKPHAADVLKRLAGKAKELELDLVACEDTAGLLPGAERVDAAALPDNIDVLVALGGDGTMLRAVRMLAGRDRPVLGVNLGSLGFLTSVTEDELERAIEVLKDGRFSTSSRSIAACSLRRDEREIGRYRALNDVVIAWGASSRVNTLEVALDGEPVAGYTCDGLIISTPTGSTGHAMAAGGPILHPESPSFVITPICPHTLSNRPLVVSDGSSICVRVLKAMKRLILSVDGQEEHEMGQGDAISVQRDEHGVRFIHLPGYSYFSVLRQKLLWRGSTV